MANTTFPSSAQDPHVDWDAWRANAALWAIPTGRVLFSLIFVVASFGHFTADVITYAATQNVPMASMLVPLSGLLCLAGGLMVMFGWHARIGAVLLLLFLVPVTFAMHAFWNYSNPMESQNQLTHFMKNIALMGGALFVCFYGAGPVSVDNRLMRHRM